MRKLIKIALIALGIRALLRWRKRRQAEAAQMSSPPRSSDPADELRQKLAASRDDDPPEASASPESSVADRRAEVHEQGRASLDEMKPTDEG